MAEVTKLSELHQDTHNANKGTKLGSKMIEESLKDYGSGRSIVVDKHNRIIGGNKTALAAEAIGMEEVIVVESDGSKIVVVKRTDLDLDTDTRAKELAIADNRASEVSLNWDTDVLQAMEIDPSKFWSPDELEKMFGIKKDLLTDEDDAPEPPADPIAKRGNLYAMGEHRLVCGDATHLPEVKRLMGDLNAVCMWTDPPYGVNYTGKTKAALTIQNDGAADLRGLLDAAFANASQFLAPGSPVYVAHPAGALNVTFGNAFLGAGWRLHQTLIWNKSSIVLGHSDYHFSHEPIFFGYTPGEGRQGRGGAHWYGNDSQKSVLDFAKPSRSESHPTMKPVALIEHMIGNSTKIGDNVLDLFGGSGSTLIACEKMKRRAFVMELDPVYADVIRNRWEAATGLKATLLEG